jgi:hypothetical protein
MKLIPEPGCPIQDADGVPHRGKSVFCFPAGFLSKRTTPPSRLQLEDDALALDRDDPRDARALRLIDVAARCRMLTVIPTLT